jgi:sugar lactone lactonase YvrE
VSGTPSEILRLDPAQLSGTGGRTPATRVTTFSASLVSLNSIAFDSDGTMWIASQEDSTLLGFAPSALSSSASVVATTRIASTNGSLSGPTGLAFDRQHRLWVANPSNRTIVRYDRSQLAAGGAQTPAVVLVGPGRPTALAFDAAGSLWVSDINSSKVFKYTASQLEASGLPTPAVVLSRNATSLVNPSGLAFDKFGNLWVANAGSRRISAFTPEQLEANGSPDPRIVLSPSAGSVELPEGLAFDSDGSLWVMGGDGVLVKFESASLRATDAPEPKRPPRAHWPRAVLEYRVLAQACRFALELAAPARSSSEQGCRKSPT